MIFEAGFGQADITPQVGTPLSGFIFRENQPSTGIDDPLFVRVLAIRHRNQINFLISFELLGIGSELYRLVISEMKRSLGDLFQEDRFVLTATHSHSGPPTVHLDGEAEPDPVYWQALARKTVQAARAAIDHLTPASLFKSSTRIPGLTYNRRAILADGRVSMALNPEAPVLSRGPIDDCVTLLVLRDSAGQNLGGIIHYACHGVTVCTQSIGSDAPGQIASRFSKLLGAPCLYLQGAAGDLNPTVVSSQREEMLPWVDVWMKAARVLPDALEPVSLTEIKSNATWVPLDYAPFPKRATILEHINGLDRIAAGDVTSLEVQTAIQLLGGIMNVAPGQAPEKSKAAYCAKTLAQAEKRTLAALERGRDISSCPLGLSVLRLGNVAMIFVAAELFAATGLKIRAFSRDLTLLPVSYASPLVGYLPDVDSVDQGGYEVDNGWQFYGHPVPFTSQAETKLLQAIQAMI